MKKKYQSSDIDRFFSQILEQAPIYNKEKVHQIINSPKAEAKLKGKPRNHLKFIVMTSIFASVLCAVLLWPGQNQNETFVPSAVEQEIAQAGRSSNPGPEKTVHFSAIKPAASDASPAADPDQTENLNLKEGRETRSEEAPIVSESPANMVPVTDTLQPIDGSRFILRLDHEELSELGFQFTDSSIVYENFMQGSCYFYNFKAKNNGTSETHLTKYPCPDNPFGSNYPFRLAGKTNLFYSELSIVGSFKPTEFQMANDTLLPVVVPLSGLCPDRMDLLFWFEASDELLDLLRKKHPDLVDGYIPYKLAKKTFPGRDWIYYRPEKIIDPTKILNLSFEELKKIGFGFYPDSTTFTGSIPIAKTYFTKDSISMTTSHSTSDSRVPIWEEGSLAVLVTRTDGSPYAKFGNLLNYLFPESGEYGSQFPLLIPVMIRSSESLFEEDVVFWFYPSKGFFDALPERMGSDLSKEYNFVMSVNKSELDQPVCKYFEECKNNLEISDFKVFPNPASDFASVSFTLPQAIDGRITLVDLAGRERQVLHPQSAMPAGAHRFELDLTQVTDGIYLITLYSNKGIQTRRLIVAR